MAQPSFASVIVQPTRGWVRLDLRQLVAYRDLIFFLAWRDVVIRYKQTVIGAAWAVLQPLLSVVVFSFFFGKLAGMPSDGVPYPVFCFAALLPWQYFASAATQASNSMVGNSALLTKVYFPRLVIPIASVLPPAVDLLVSLVVLFAMITWYGVPLTWKALWLVPLIGVAGVASLGLGVWLAALNVRYRDVRHAVPFLLQIAMFASPVVYPASLVPQPWRVWYGLNPMTGVIEGVRWCLLGSHTRPGAMVLASAAVAGGLLMTGLCYFQRTERTFADVV